jgi:hypothetical protein
MKLKHLIVLVVVLALISAGTYFATRTAPAPSSDPRIGQPLVASDVVNKTEQLKISDQGKSVTLAKHGDGQWTVTSYYDFPVDFQKLSGFVGDLNSAKIEQLVTTNPQRLAHLDFKDTQIAFLGNNNAALETITLGKNADAGGRFVRFGDETKGYRASLNAWIDADPKSWANASLTSDLKADDVEKVEITFPDAPSVVATRAKKGDPFVSAATPADQQLSQTKLNSLLSSLGSLRFSDTTDPKDANAVAARANERSVKLTTFDGHTLTIAMGRKPEQKIVKAPTAKPDGKTGPAALGKVTAASTDKPDQGGPAKAIAPETETIPAGPVFAFVTNSDEHAPINAMMKTRAFQIYDYTYTELPQKPADLFEAAPKPSPTPTPAPKRTPTK